MDNNTKLSEIKNLLILHDHHNQDKIKENISSIFKNIHKLNKGIQYIENESHISIDNKYYTCQLNISIKTIREDFGENNEGVIIYWKADNLNTDRISQAINSLKKKPSCLIILFEEERSFLSSLSSFEEFVGYSIDNNLEIIAGIRDFENVDEEDGIGALNMSLQSCHWPNSIMKKMKKLEDKKIDTVETIEQKPVDLGYQQLKEEAEFDHFLEKINEVRRMNTNENMSDEERRRNAENALLMLAKYMNFGDDEGVLDDDEEENNNN
jgi:hypothetical protein